MALTLTVVLAVASGTPTSAATRPALVGGAVATSEALPTQEFGVACGTSSCSYAGQLSPVYTAPLTWSNTPSLFGVPLGGNVGWASARPRHGVVTVGAITDGIADQGVEDWLQAVYNAPNPTGTSSAWDSLTVHAHIYTEVLSNNFGVFSNTSASFLDFVLQAQGAETEQDVAVNTGASIGPPDSEDMGTLEQGLDSASSQMQNAATSAISVAEGQASPQSAFSNSLTSALGATVYQTDLTLSVSAYVNGHGAEPVYIDLSPELGVANAGLGITGTYAVSLVQLNVSGTSQPTGVPTSLSLHLFGPNGQTLPTDSHGFPKVSFAQALELKASLHSSGGSLTLSGPKVDFDIPSVEAGGRFSCTLQDGTCTARVPISWPVPPGFRVVDASVHGLGRYGYAGSATSAMVDVRPAPSQLRVVAPWADNGTVRAGQSYGVSVFVSAASGIDFLGRLTGGTVSLLDDGAVVGTCTPADTNRDVCNITWVPSLGADVATRSARLEVAWTGNRTYLGSADELANVTVVHHGVGPFLTADPPALGYSWSEACSTNKFGGTTCKPKLTLRTSGTLTAQVLSSGQPVQYAIVQLSANGPGSLSASTCTTGQDGSCRVTVKVPVSKTTVPVEVGAKTNYPHGAWRQSLALLDMGLYGASAPSVSGVTPASGPVTGGNTVQVRGQDLWGASKVTFGGVPAPSFSVQTDGSVMAVAPRGEGTCNVQVTTPLGTSAPNAADRYSFGSAPASAKGAVVLPGDLNGLAPVPGGGAWASLSPPGTGGAPSPAGSLALVDDRGSLARRYLAPSTTGQMALYGGDLYYLAMTGTNYTNWQTTLVRLSPSTGATKRFSYTAAPTGAGGVAVGSNGAPVYLGVSEIGGAYGVPVVLEVSTSTGRFTARTVPSPQGGGVGGLAAAPDGGVWGIVPKSAEVFWLRSAGGAFRTWPAPGPTTPVSLDGIIAAGPMAYAAVAGAVPGTVGALAVDSANGRTSWLPAPKDIVSVSGLAWDRGLWVGAVTAGGVAGALGYGTGGWRFVPAYAHASASARLFLAPGGPGELWLGQAGGDRLWRLSSSPSATTRPLSGPPVVTRISPASGPTAGGTAVRVTGSNFTGANAVSFGPLPAGGFTVVSGTEITATSTWYPASRTVTVDVTVNTPAGTSATNSADRFTYVAPPSPGLASLAPTSGPPGTTVTLEGSGFGTSPGRVTFTPQSGGRGLAATILHWSGTTIVCTVPSGLPAGPARPDVWSAAGLPAGPASVAAWPEFDVTSPPGQTPTISGLSPASAHTGAQFTITGRDLGSAAGGTVRFCDFCNATPGSDARVTSWTPTAIVGIVPGGLQCGGATVWVTVGGWRGQAGHMWITCGP